MYLSIAAIFRNEAPYLKEWIEFHLEVGCEHFYLFDNLSTDSFQQVLKPYAHLIDLISWPLAYTTHADWAAIQCLAYEKAIHLSRGKTTWLALLDTDEFLFSPQAPLIDTLSNYESFGGVAVNWQVFGTSHIPQIPQNQLLIETLHLKLPTTSLINHMVKSIVRPETVASCPSSHYVVYKPGYSQVNTDRVPFTGRDSPYVQVNDLRINHYQTRDEAYLHTQKIPRTRAWWDAKSPEQWEELYNSYNQVHDDTIFRFIPRLQEKMF